jgi:Amt family ammonium transporter
MRVDTGDTAWVLVSAALVMFMTPGLALFYGGLVRAKNVLGTVMQSLIALGVVTVLWVLIGYSLAFGSDHGLLTGGLEYVGLRGVGADPTALAPSVPASSFMVFQMMFAVITPALITGAFADGCLRRLPAVLGLVVARVRAGQHCVGVVLGAAGGNRSTSREGPSCT